MLGLTAAILVAYTLLIAWFKHGFMLMERFSRKTELLNLPSTYPKISVLVIVKNEGQTIQHCLNSIFSGTNSSHISDVTVVDTGSTDQTMDVLSHLSEKYPLLNIQALPIDLQSRTSPKKTAIEWVLPQLKGDWILLTDGDCIVPLHWVRSMLAQIRDDVHMICGPVAYSPAQFRLSHWLALDYLVMMLLSAGAIGKHFPITNNAANLMFRKKTFQTIGGFYGNSQLATGDDDFLMQKMHNNNPGCVIYQPSSRSLVQTLPPSSWNEFVNQRKRWASKGTRYGNLPVSLFLAGIYLLHLFFLGLTIYWLSQGLIYVFMVLGMLVYKSIVDYQFVSLGEKLALVQYSWLHLFGYQPLQILYILVFGLLGLLGSYRWKDRDFSS